MNSVLVLSSWVLYETNYCPDSCGVSFDIGLFVSMMTVSGWVSIKVGTIIWILTISAGGVCGGVVNTQLTPSDLLLFSPTKLCFYSVYFKNSCLIFDLYGTFGLTASKLGIEVSNCKLGLCFFYWTITWSSWLAITYSEIELNWIVLVNVSTSTFIDD